MTAVEMSSFKRFWRDYLNHLFGLLLFGLAFSGLVALAFPDYLPAVSDASFAEIFVDATRFYALYILLLWAITSVFVRWTLLKVSLTGSMERVQWRKKCDDLHSPSLITLFTSFIVLVGYTEKYAGEL